MITKIKKYSGKKKVIYSTRDNQIDGEVILKEDDQVHKLNFSNGELSGINYYQGYKFIDNRLVINDKEIKPEEDDSWFIPETSKRIIFDLNMFEIKEGKIEFPKYGFYQDSIRRFYLENGKLDETSPFYQMIDGKLVRFLIKDGKVISYDDIELNNGYYKKMKLKFKYDPENYLIKIELDKYPTDGVYSGEGRWINFKDGKISMEGFTHYSFKQDIDGKKWYFKIDNNKILKVGFNCDNMKQVQEDGTCPELKKKFTLDLDDYQMKVEDLPEKSKYPINGGYVDEGRWINFRNGKISMEGDPLCSFRQDINRNRWYFEINDNKILKAGYHLDYMKQVQEDGSCPKLGKKFTLDLDDYQMKIEDLPGSDPRWMYIKNGKLSINGNIYYHFEQDSDENWYFEINDNKILKAGDNYDNMKQVQDDGICPELKKKFIFDLDGFRIKMEDLPSKYPLNGTFQDETRWINFEDGKISMEGLTYYSFIEKTNSDEWYFEIDNNKILKAGTDYNKMKQVQDDGSCPELKKKFTLDLDDYQIKMEDLPRNNKYPLNGGYIGETRWINFKNGKISMEYTLYYSMFQIINGNGWFFEIDNNKILLAGTSHLKMKQVQEDGSCPELKKKFTLDLDDFQIKMEDLPGVRKPKVEKPKVEKSETKKFKEVRSNKSIVYHVVNDLVVKKEYYHDDELYKVRITN